MVPTAFFFKYTINTIIDPTIGAGVMEQADHIKRQLQQLFERQNLAVLATQSDGQPYASLVAFKADQNLRQIYFATARSTRKFANLSSDPRVALLINSSVNEPSDFHRAIAVTVQGRAEIIDNKNRQATQKQYLNKHPYLSEFVRSPTCALLSIHVRSYYLVKNFQHVMELHFDEEVA